MPKWIIRGLMTNLKTWIKLEQNVMYRKCYMEYYLDMKEKLEQA